MAQPAMAGVLDDDMAFAFGNSPTASSDLGEMALLSDQEMVATEGEFGPWGAVGGAGIGAWNYFGSSLGSGSFSATGLAYHVASGAAIGAVTGPIGLTRYYYGSRVSGAVGFGSGYGSSNGWW